MKTSKKKTDKAVDKKEGQNEKLLNNNRTQKALRATKLDEFEWAVKVCSNIFSRDYSHNLPTDKIKKILVVEGTTDKAFYERSAIRRVDVAVIDMGKELAVIKNAEPSNNRKEAWEVAHDKAISKKNAASSSKILTENKSHNDSKNDSQEDSDKQKIPDIKPGVKNIIIAILRALKNYKYKLIDRENWDNFRPFDGHVYGIVDKDNDPKNQAYGMEGHIFVTDTHDLETLILSSDKRAHYIIGEKSFTQEQLDKACYLAYQLGNVREAILKITKGETDRTYVRRKAVREALAGKNANKYLGFKDILKNNNDSQINLDEVIKRINEYIINIAQKELPIEPPILDLETDKDVSVAIKEYFDEDNNWKVPVERCKKLHTEEKWGILNGHDIAAALRFVNEDLKELKSVERALVDTYDVINFYNTKLGQDLAEANLIKPKSEVCEAVA